MIWTYGNTVSISNQGSTQCLKRQGVQSKACLHVCGEIIIISCTKASKEAILIANLRRTDMGMKKEKKTKGVKIQPLFDRVLVKELKEEATERLTASGIILPASVGEDKGAKHGEVIAVGPGKVDDGVRIKPEVRIGDTVLFQWGDMLKIDDEEYYILREENILAVIK